MTPEQSWWGLREVKKQLKKTYRWQGDYPFKLQESVDAHHQSCLFLGRAFIDKYSILTTGRYPVDRRLLDYFNRYHDNHEAIGGDIPLADTRRHQRKEKERTDRSEMQELMKKHHLPPAALFYFDAFEHAKTPQSYTHEKTLPTALIALGIDGFNGCYTYALHKYVIKAIPLTEEMAKIDASHIAQRVIRPPLFLFSMYQDIGDRDRTRAASDLIDEMITLVINPYATNGIGMLKEALEL